MHQRKKDTFWVVIIIMGSPKSNAFWGEGDARKRADDFLHKKIEAKRTLLRRGGPSGTRTPDQPVMSRLL